MTEPTNPESTDSEIENIFDDSEGPASPPTSPTSPTSPISPPISPPSPPASECLNGEDDDGDGFVDDNDPNCHTDGDSNNNGSYNPDGSESGTLPMCWNGIDDDGDGLTDWAPAPGGDPGCSTPTDGSEGNDPVPPPLGIENTLTLCADFVDNDGDILVDLADTDCASFIPTLTVIKVVINDNAGTSAVNNFPLFVGATSVVSAATTTFATGTYSVSETSNSGASLLVGFTF